jgi:hypothetical protein
MRQVIADVATVTGHQGRFVCAAPLRRLIGVGRRQRGIWVDHATVYPEGATLCHRVHRSRKAVPPTLPCDLTERARVAAPWNSSSSGRCATCKHADRSQPQQAQKHDFARGRIGATSISATCQRAPFVQNMRRDLWEVATTATPYDRFRIAFADLAHRVCADLAMDLCCRRPANATTPPTCPTGKPTRGAYPCNRPASLRRQGARSWPTRLIDKDLGK